MYIQSFAAQVILWKESEPSFLYLSKHYVFLDMNIYIYIYIGMYVSTNELSVVLADSLLENNAFRKVML